MVEVEFRECGACGDHYKGRFGECPKCNKQHNKKVGYIMAGRQGKKCTPTLDGQEGNNES